MDIQDWESFFSSFPSLSLVVISSVSEKNNYKISKEEFFQHILSYTKSLQASEVVDLAPYRKMFSIALSEDEEDFSVQPLANDRVLIKQKKPMVQFRPASFFIDENLEVKTKMIGKDTISWGIEIAYPQTFQDPDTKEIKNGLTDYPNGSLFKEIMRWVRKNTRPVQIIFQSRAIQSNLRLGNNALQWIDQYERLNKKQIKISL